MRKSFAKGWRNARWRDMLLAFLFWLSNGESLIRLPLHPTDDLLVEVPPLMFVSPIGISEGEEEQINENETSEGESGEELTDEDEEPESDHED
jgi:hypothetical protein